MRISISLTNKKKREAVINLSQPEALDNILHMYSHDYEEDPFLQIQNYKETPKNLPHVPGLVDDFSGSYFFREQIIIRDETHSIENIFTNVPELINITKTIKKTLTKKFSIFVIRFTPCSKNKGYIKITFSDSSKEERMYGIYMKDAPLNRVELGCLENPLDKKFWTSNTFISKYVDEFYFVMNEKTIDNAYDYIRFCSEFGTNITFIYSVFFDNDKGVEGQNVPEKIYSSEYMESYMAKFRNFIENVKKWSQPYQDIKIIFEPYLLSKIYETGMIDHNTRLFRYYSKEWNIRTFIAYINNVASKTSNISIAHVFNIEVVADACITKPYNDLEDMKRNIQEQTQKSLKFYKPFFTTGSNFVAFDKYYMDGGYTKDKKWLWNNDQWMNYLFFVITFTKGLREYTLRDIQAVMYNIPTGHMNNSIEISPFTNKVYENHTNKMCDSEDNSSLFLLGGGFIPSSPKFYSNLWGDDKFSMDEDVVNIKPHSSLCKEYFIKSVLFGPSSSYSTSHLKLPHTGGKITDHDYTLSKLNEFYKK